MGSIGAVRGSSVTAQRYAQAYGPNSPINQPVNANNPDVANQTPNAQNTPVGTDAALKFSQLDDNSMAALINAAKRAVLPNQLADSDDITQRVVFQAGINEKPMVLDRQSFDKFVKDNNLQSHILSRTFGSGNYTNPLGRRVNLTPQDVDDMNKYSRVNYIGGKHGGMMLGAGTYLAVRGIGQGTGYGSGNTLTSNAVLNPATARIVDWNALPSMARSWAASHPATARALGSFSMRQNGSAYALAMGYNVIAERSSIKSLGYDDYVNVIDRRALVWLK